MADPLTELERRAADTAGFDTDTVRISGARLAELCAVARAAQQYKAAKSIPDQSSPDAWRAVADAERFLYRSVVPLVREEPNE